MLFTHYRIYFRQSRFEILDYFSRTDDFSCFRDINFLDIDFREKDNNSQIGKFYPIKVIYIKFKHSEGIVWHSIVL